jgi:hypothetical protein
VCGRVPISVLVLALAGAGCRGEPVGEAFADDGGAGAGGGTSDGGPSDGGSRHVDAFAWELVYEDALSEPGDILYDLWAAGPDAIHAVGTNRQIVSFDGQKWQGMVRTSGIHLRGIWGSSASDITAVGLQISKGTAALYRYDGQKWGADGPLPALMTPLMDVWGIGTERYMIGSAGHVFVDDPIGNPAQRFHTTFETDLCPTVVNPSPQLNAISGNQLGNVLIGADSSRLVTRDSNQWKVLCTPGLVVHYSAVESVPGTEQYYIGTNYLGLIHWQSRDSVLQIHEDRAIAAADQAFIRGIFTDATSRVIAVGDRGTILAYDGGPTGAVQLSPPSKDDLYAVWGHDQIVYVTGAGSRIWRGTAKPN